MTLQEIRQECWAIARENGIVDDDRLWTTAEMNRYINRTYRFIARETRCIRDAITAAVCQIAVAPPASAAALQALAATDVFYAYDWAEYQDSSSWMYQTLVAPRMYPIHASIIDIDEIKWHTQPWRLQHVSVTKWQQNPRWEQVVGYPIEYATDYNTGYIALNFRYAGTDTLMLLVRRLPLVNLIADTDTPEFRTSYHDYFVNGVLEQMYSKQDANTIDLKKADSYHQAFMKDIDEIEQKLNVNHSLGAFR
jgi:hypothetical protein